MPGQSKCRRYKVVRVECSCGHAYDYMLGTNALHRDCKAQTIADLASKPCPPCALAIRPIQLSDKPMSIEQIATYTGIPVSGVADVLAAAELRGEVRCHHSGHYVRA